MKKTLLLGAALWLLPSVVFAQCAGVGGINTVPQTGVTCASEPVVGTYRATAIGLVPAASATDVFCLNGSATKVVRLQFLRASGTAGTAVVLPIKLNVNSALDTGGTGSTSGAAAPVAIALDSNNLTATASPFTYTGNPTIGGTASVLDSANLILTLTGTATGAAPDTLFDYTARNFSEAPTIRTNAAQQFCVNLNGVSVSSGAVNITMGWTEAPQ